MDDCRLDAPLLVKQVEDDGIFDVEDRLERHVPLHERVVGLVDDAHAAAAEGFAKFVAIAYADWGGQEITFTIPFRRKIRTQTPERRVGRRMSPILLQGPVWRQEIGAFSTAD
ncbi:MAG: hypothetical protein R2724_30790 [Bryobacterales bacterium]